MHGVVQPQKSLQYLFASTTKHNISQCWALLYFVGNEVLVSPRQEGLAVSFLVNHGEPLLLSGDGAYHGYGGGQPFLKELLHLPQPVGGDGEQQLVIFTPMEGELVGVFSLLGGKMKNCFG